MSPHPPTASTSKLPPTRLTIKLPADRRKVTSSNSEALETAFLSTPVPALPSETTATEKSKGKKRARVEFAPVDAGLVPEVSDFGRTQGFDQLSSDELVAFRRMGPEELRARVELGKRTAEMEQLVEEAKKSRGGQLLEMMINEGAPAVANLAEQIGNTILKNEALERGELPEKVRESFSTTSEGLDSVSFN